MQYKGRQIKNKTRKRNGVVGRALPSNCRDGGGRGRRKEKFNNYLINNTFFKQFAEEDTLSL